MRPMERWSSRLGVVLAVAGSAVGLGNFLRFPGQAVAHGGGAFMIPYVCALVFLGIPIGWAEWTMGRYGGQHGHHSAPSILGFIAGPRARDLGVLGLLVPLCIYMYYGIVESWCLRYAWEYLTGTGIASASSDVGAAQRHFEAVSGLGGHGEAYASVAPVVFAVIVLALNLWLLRRGLSGGIERFCRAVMPIMAVCALLVLVRVLTLGTPDPAHPERSVLDGLGYLWNPNFESLLDFETWLAASSQVFFSLSVGFGVIINYASYLRRQDDVVLSSLTAAATNEVFEVGFGGLITVTATYVFLGASAVAGGVFALGFNTLPVVFAHMGLLGRAVGFLWFLVLFLAAITSSLSMLQPVKAFVQESLRISPNRAVTFVGVVAAAGGGWVLFFSEDLVALDTMDFWVGTVGIFCLAALQLYCLRFAWGLPQAWEEAHRGARMQIPRVFRFVLAWIAPAYLLVVMVGFAVQNFGKYADHLRRDPVAAATVVFVLFVAGALLVLARRRTLP